MPASKRNTGPVLRSEGRRKTFTDLAKLDAHVVRPEEYDDLPELTAAELDRSVLMRGGIPVKRGRPKAAVTKRAVNLRLSPDVLDFFRATGPGWQTRIDQALRKAAGLK